MIKLPDSLSPFADFLARHSAIVALAVFAVVGVSVLDDYGVGYDEEAQRVMGIASLDYVLGDEDALIDENDHDKFYGVALEVPLVVVERLLRLEDSRAIHLSRRLIAHLFFLAGGFFAWLLAYRLFGSRLVALLAMLLFLLHPRIYAHTFFNTKDPPFMAMFMISLYLTHRAFRRDSVWAFALCGVGVGLLVNFRIMGAMLFPAVLGMLALDALYAVKRGAGEGVKHIFINTCVFSAMSIAALYAAWPLLWRDPSQALDALRTLSIHPVHIETLFRGEIIRYPDIPWDFIPTWILMTTPLVALALAALGIGCVARLCAADWRGALANSTARFGLLAAACLILPVAATIALNANLYQDWRHFYFIYAPLCVLAAFGLRWLAAIPKPRLRTAAFALAALGLAAAAAQMVRLHPYQQEYFNALVDKNGAADRWAMDYWHVSYREALETLLKMQPVGIIILSSELSSPFRFGNLIIPEDDRRRFVLSRKYPSFRIAGGDVGNAGYPVVWKREVYGAPIVSILDARAETEGVLRAAYDAALESEPAASGGGFDIYADGETLTYVKEVCGEEDWRSRFALSAFPANPSDLPQAARDDGLEYERFDFYFHEYGATLDGRCVIIRDLTDHAMSHVETGQYLPGEERLWSVQIPLGGYRERYERALSSLSGAAAASGGGFDVYADGEALTYVKKDCGEEDARSRFALSVFPVDPSDLPQTARDDGLEYERLDFAFQRRGMRLDGGCLAVRRLPEYPISHVETGQYLPGESLLWSAKIPLAGYRERYARALSELAGEPAARSGFDIWLNDGALTYIKESCDAEDAGGRFFLSVFPADRNDLPQGARDAGREHESLNFDFDRYGAIVDGRCVIVRYLPDYPISHIETGQWLEGEGELWRAEIEAGRGEN